MKLPEVTARRVAECLGYYSPLDRDQYGVANPLAYLDNGRMYTVYELFREMPHGDFLRVVKRWLDSISTNGDWSSDLDARIKRLRARHMARTFIGRRLAAIGWLERQLNRARSIVGRLPVLIARLGAPRIGFRFNDPLGRVCNACARARLEMEVEFTIAMRDDERALILYFIREFDLSKGVRNEQA